MSFLLKSQSRSRGRLNRLRKEGWLPAVVYGPRFPSCNISVSYHDFVRVFRQAGHSQVVEIQAKGEKNPVLIHDVQLDPVLGRFLHVDFYCFESGSKVQATIPLEFQGLSHAVKDKGGVLLTNLREILVRALPEKLVSSIPIDLSSLVNIGDEIKVKDLPIEQGIEIVTDLETVIVSIVSPARVEEVTENLQAQEQKEPSKESQETKEGE